MNRESPLIRENSWDEKRILGFAASLIKDLLAGNKWFKLKYSERFKRTVTTAILLPKGERIGQHLVINLQVGFLAWIPLKNLMSINFLHHSAQCFHCSVLFFPLMLLVVSLHNGLHQFMEIHSTTLLFFFFWRKKISRFSTQSSLCSVVTL